MHEQERTTSASATIASVLPVLAIGLPVLVQGGFFAFLPCLVGLLASVAAAVTLVMLAHRARPVAGHCILLLCLVLVYALSSVANGLTLTTLAETGSWAACAAVAVWATCFDGRTYDRAMGLLCGFGCLTAVLGVAVRAGLVVLPDGMTGSRLQMSFQYANAAGAWYAAIALLCMYAPDVRLRRLTCLPATCLLMTQSVGGIVVFAALALPYPVTLVRLDDTTRLAETLAQAIIALGSFALFFVVPGPVAFVAVIALVGAWVRWSEAGATRVATVGMRRLILASVACVGVAVLLALTVFPARLAQAAATLVERLYHIHDGFAMALARPLLGVGPDNWQYLYRYVQTAQYETTVVHSSYVQVLTDAGFVGCALLLAACVVGLRRLAGHDEADGWVKACRTAALLVVAHAAVDFDLQFSSLAYLLVWLLACPQEGSTGQGHESHGRRLRRSAGMPTAAACLALCVPLCLSGALCSLYASALQRARATGDDVSFQRLYEANPLARADRAALELELARATEAKDYRRVTKLFDATHNPSDTCALLAARAHYALDERQEGGLALIELMERQPYNTDLMEASHEFFAREGIEESLRPRYHAAVVHANGLARRVNGLLPQTFAEDAL